MKNNEIMTKVSRTIHKIGFHFQKKSPEILVGVGIVGVVVSTVMACKATTKAGKVLDEVKESIDTIHTAEENGVTNAGEEYSRDDCKKDLIITYAHSSISFAKLYGPSVLLGVASIASILASHNVLKKRNIALAAAYAAVDKSFKDYRGRVLERFGEEVEKEIQYGIKAKEIETSGSDADGNEKIVKESADIVSAGFDPNLYSPYAKIFDETHPDWHKDAEQNLYYLKARQSQANDMLRARGHLFLNEVYDLLGFPRTKAGAVVGWIYDLKHPIGDNFVDFRIYDIRREKARDFVNGYEPAIILDFNVCGDILDQVSSHQFL